MRDYLKEMEQKTITPVRKNRDNSTTNIVIPSSNERRQQQEDNDLRCYSFLEHIAATSDEKAFSNH